MGINMAENSLQVKFTKNIVLKRQGFNVGSENERKKEILG